MTEKTAIQTIIWHMENEPVEATWQPLKEAMNLLMKEQLNDAFKAGAKFGYLMERDPLSPHAVSFEAYYKSKYQDEQSSEPI